MIKRLKSLPLVIGATLIVVVINSVVLLNAFEAHVINVTAKIEPRPSQCDVQPHNYWTKNEGCQSNGGVSVWAEDINNLSQNFSGVFINYDGAQICTALWPDNCPSAETREGKMCLAKQQALVWELNLVSRHLSSEALLAGADNGSGAFRHLELSATSTVGEALTKIESLIADEGTVDGYLLKATQVMRRLIDFYRFDNPIAPQCLLEPDELSFLNNGPSESEEVVTVSVGKTSSSDVEVAPSTLEAATTTEEIAPEPVTEETVEESPALESELEPATEEAEAIEGSASSEASVEVAPVPEVTE